MKVGGFSEHQNQRIDTGRYKGYFHSARIFQVNVKTMKRIFKQRSELQVAKCLIFHVLSGSYNVSSLELRNKREATHQWSLRVANDIVLNEVRVYYERVCGQGRKQNLVCEVFLFSTFPQNHCQHYFRKWVPDLY